MDIDAASIEELRADNLRIRKMANALIPELMKTEKGRLNVEAKNRREDTEFVHSNGITETYFGTWSLTHMNDPRKTKLAPIVYRQYGTTWVRIS